MRFFPLCNSRPAGKLAAAVDFDVAGIADEGDTMVVSLDPGAFAVAQLVRMRGDDSAVILFFAGEAYRRELREF
jgi:hypothetical protein